MIVDRLRLHPFAGAANMAVEFVPGLNVLLGPNEAGKTTLSNALRRVLFAHAPMTQPRFRTEILPFLPTSGGDTIKVTLDFRSAEKRFQLAREWTAPKSLNSRLQLPDGAVLADPDAIEEIVRNALGVAEGTYENVLSVTQSQLALTIDRLAEEIKGSSGDFADVLRRSLYQSDGVAVDRLVKELKARIGEYFGRWDREKSRPEKGHEIDNPWEKGAGFIVNAYYKYRRAVRDYDQARAYEQRLDDFVAREKILAEKCEQLSRFLHEHEAGVGDARRRAEITRALNEKRKDAVELRGIVDRWPRAEEQLSSVTTSLQALLEKHAVLENEYKEAQERLRQQSVREQFRKAEELQSRLVDEERSLAALHPVNEKQVERLQKASAKLQQAEIRIAARKLALRLAAKAGVNVTVNHDGLDENVRLKAGEEYATTAGGQFSIRHDDWSLDVRAAGDDMEALEREQAQVQSEMREQLGSIKLKSLEEAIAARRSFVEQTTRVQQAKAGLDAVLGGISFEGLAQQVKALSRVQSGRSPEEIKDEQLSVRGEGESKRSEQKSLSVLCNDWKQRYGNQDALLSVYMACKTDEQNMEKALADARPIPEEFPDPESFIRAFESARKDHAAAQQALNDIQKERLSFEKGEPRESCRELEGVVVSTKEEFDNVLARGKSYVRIEDELSRLLRVLDSDMFTAYHRRVEALMSEMTLWKYSSLQMDGSLPQRINGSGKQLGIDHLSLGTLDILALAVRIAMAEGYVNSGDGFLLMDDPLVNLDPARQAVSAECLRKFSASRQTIILTCHPEHADLLGGHRIDLA